MNILRRKAWNPYIVGLLVALLSWFALLSADHPLGITTAFEYTGAIILQPFAKGLGYFSSEDNNPKIDWEWALVLGVFIGAWISSHLSRDRGHSSLPPLWKRRFGNNVQKRMTFSFFGGALMMYGARLAQGCTSGHGISGVMQFALSSWIFVPAFGLAGFVVARFIYKGIRDV